MLFGLLLSIACMYSANAQIPSCPLITINDLGSTTELSTDGLIAEAIVPPGEGGGSSRVPVRIRDFTIVCDASGTRINTSSFVSVVVELQCDSQSINPSLSECDGSTIDIRQYQFQCTEKNGQSVWGNTVAGSSLFVQTLNPTATLSTPLANQCRRCIDDQQSMRAGLDPMTHCDREFANSVIIPCMVGHFRCHIPPITACLSECNQGQRRCYIGPDGNECCNFYLQGNCVNNCSSALVNDSNFNCGK